MTANNLHDAEAPRASTPTSDEAPAVARGEAFTDRVDSVGGVCAAVALRKRAVTPVHQYQPNCPAVGLPAYLGSPSAGRRCAGRMKEQGRGIGFTPFVSWAVKP